MEDGFALGLAMYGVTNASQIDQRLALYQKIRRNRAASIQILSNYAYNEEVPKELAGYLEGRPIPSKQLTTHIWLKINEASWKSSERCG